MTCAQSDLSVPGVPPQALEDTASRTSMRCAAGRPAPAVAAWVPGRAGSALCTRHPCIQSITT